MEVAGVKDVLAKSLGTSNAINVVRATMVGLSELKDPEGERQRRTEAATAPVENVIRHGKPPVVRMPRDNQGPRRGREPRELREPREGQGQIDDRERATGAAALAAPAMEPSPDVEAQGEPVTAEAPEGSALQPLQESDVVAQDPAEADASRVAEMAEAPGEEPEGTVTSEG
jgi:hypothetical protein